MSGYIFTLEFSDSEGRTYRAANRPFQTDYPWRQDLLTLPSRVSRIYAGAGSRVAATALEPGEFTLANGDGYYDALLERGLDGLPAVMKMGAPGEAFEAFRTITTGTIARDGVEAGLDALRLRLDDRLSELRFPCAAVFAGTGGAEGEAETVSGQRKPKLLGAPFNAPARIIDKANQIFALSDGPVSITAAAPGEDGGLYDRGVALTRGPDYVDEADLIANVPDPGTYRLWPAGGCGRYGTVTGGPLTALAQASPSSIGGLLTALARRRLDEGEVNAVAASALDALQGAPLGWFGGGEVEILEVMEALAGPLGVYFGFNRAGILTIGRLDAPSGDPDAYFHSATGRAGSFHILDITPITAPVPARSMTVEYARNHNVQTDNLDSDIAPELVKYLDREWRSEIAEAGAGVTGKHRLAAEASLQCAFTAAPDAAAEAARALALTGVKGFEISVALDPALFDVIDIGSVIHVTHPRLGLAAGVLAVATGEALQLRDNRVVYSAWLP